MQNKFLFRIIAFFESLFGLFRFGRKRKPAKKESKDVPDDNYTLF